MSKPWYDEISVLSVFFLRCVWNVNQQDWDATPHLLIEACERIQKAQSPGSSCEFSRTKSSSRKMLAYYLCSALTKFGCPRTHVFFDIQYLFKERLKAFKVLIWAFKIRIVVSMVRILACKIQTLSAIPFKIDVLRWSGTVDLKTHVNHRTSGPPM